MDMERIKQNFRLRSGRTKKHSKQSKTSTASENNYHSGTKQTESSATPKEAPRSESQAKSSSQSKSQGSRDRLKRVDSGLGESQTSQEKPNQDIKSPGKSSASGEMDAQAEDTHADAMSGHENEEGVKKGSSRSSSPRKSPSRPTRDSANGSSQIAAHRSTDSLDFDFKPSAAKAKAPSLESTSELLFSSGHLNFLLHYPPSLAQFTAFLQKYRPQYMALLLRYLEASKAIAAIEYANAVAESAPSIPDQDDIPRTAASVNDAFETSFNLSFETLLNEALPLFITYNLVKTVSECLVNEVTGRSTPLMRELTDGLSEVFCITNPSQPDNPIIYASEEFYRLTGYGQDDVIGYNCRFLQGAKTAKQSIVRLKEGVQKGEEVCETLLNYRRDGRPFINILLISPLHDDKGNVKYYIGAQVDATGLINSGRTLEGFRKYLGKREMDRKREDRDKKRHLRDKEAQRKSKALSKLRDLSELFDLEESSVVQSHSRSSSLDRDEDARSLESSTPRISRKVLGAESSDEDEDEEAEKNAWSLAEAGPQGQPSGKLPGVYEKYMLIRPAPSLRIVFVSQKLRRFGKILQSPFLAHIAASDNVLTGLSESFSAGVPVTAKVHFMSERGDKRDGTRISANAKHENGKHGRTCWIAATPLLGADDDIGVWMVVVVEKSQATVQMQRNAQNYQKDSAATAGVDKYRRSNVPKPGEAGQTEPKEGDKPIKPIRIETNPQQNSSTNRNIAAAPVEEYRSDRDDNEEGLAQPKEQRDASPNSVDNDGSGDEEYVVPKAGRSGSESSRRGRIESESRDDISTAATDPDFPEESASHTFESHDAPPNFPSELDFQDLPDEDDIDGGQPQSNGDDMLDSPLTARQRSIPSSPHGNSRSDSDEESTSNGRSKGALPAGMAYMDYLRHPGTGRRRLSGREEDRGRKSTRYSQEDSDGTTDADCRRSPYSVD